MAEFADAATLQTRYGRNVQRDKEGRVMLSPAEEAKGFFDGIDPGGHTGQENQAPGGAPMAGLQSAIPAPSTPPAAAPGGGSAGGDMSTFSPIVAGGAAPSGAPSAGSTGSGGTVIQGQMDPGPGFVESGTGAGALRGLGQRRPAEQSMALAGLGRAY